MTKRRKKAPVAGLTDQEAFEAEALYNMMQEYGIEPTAMDMNDLTLIDRWLAEEDEREALLGSDMTIEEYHEAVARAEAEPWDDEDVSFDMDRQLPFDFDTEETVGKHRRKYMYDHDKWSRGYSHDPKRNSLICPPPGLIRVISDDGATLANFRIDPRDGWWFRNATMAYPDGVHTVGDEVVIDIPMSQCQQAITRVTPAFSSCTFDSTKDYLASLFGTYLHSTDKDWLSKHPHAEEMGVPAEYTPGAIQGLLEPYGFGVSRIRIKAGSWFTGAALDQWMVALGVNHKAMVDHTTSNTEIAEELGMSVEEADALYRFEFEPHPFRPGILGERAAMGIDSGLNGKRGGHFRYLAPRDGNSAWFISLQLDRLENIAYHVEPVLPEYVPRADALKLNIYQVKTPGGPDVDDVVWYNRWVEAGSPGKLEAPETTIITPAYPPSTPASPTRSAAGSGASSPGSTVAVADLVFEPTKQIAILSKAMENTDTVQDGSKIRCASCQRWQDEKIMVAGLEEVCIPCYIGVWKPYRCANNRCQQLLDIDHLPDIHLSGLPWSCPKCKLRFGNGADSEIAFLSMQIIEMKDVKKTTHGGGMTKVVTTNPDGSKIVHWTIH